MASGNNPPLYTYLPPELHQYLDSIKKEKDINKTDTILLLVELARKYLTPNDIEALFGQFVVLGSEGIYIEALETEKEHS